MNRMELSTVSFTPLNFLHKNQANQVITTWLACHFISISFPAHLPQRYLVQSIFLRL